MAQKIQPIVFLGCREATRAPTAENDTNTSNAQISKGSGVWLTPVGGGEFRYLNDAQTIMNASERANSDQARRKVARELIPLTLHPCLLVPCVTTPLYSTTVSQALRLPLRGEGPKDTRLHQLPARIRWWPGGCEGGASGIHCAMDRSSESKPTTHKSRDHQQKGGPRKEKEQKWWDTNYFSWSNRSTLARGG
jgi:hypothetical protein